MTSYLNYKGDLRVDCTHVKSQSVVTTDAPTDNNGKGMKFSPTDLVATSLASCMITVMAIRAAKSNILFSKVSAEVTKIMASDPRRISEIKIDLKVEDNWSENEKVLLEKIGRSCPVALSLGENVSQNIQFLYMR